MKKDAKPVQEATVLTRLETALGKRSTLWVGLSMAICAIFSILLFDGRLSFATDDATYIQNAIAFVKRHSYPTYQGALYPFFLSLLTKIFGVRLLLFKSFSILFLILQIWFLYKALKNRIPNVALFAGLFTISLNAYILAYGSSTFTESFFMMMQALALWTFFSLNEKLEKSENLKDTIVNWALFGLVFFLLSITKNVAIFAVGGVVLFFLIKKEWKNAGLTVLSFGIFKVVYELIVRSIYGNTTTSQLDQLMRKDFNDPSQGYVDFGDLVTRFFENFGNYISVHTFKILGLRGPGVPSLFTFDKQAELQTPLEPNILLSILFLALIGTAIYFAFKWNRTAFYLSIYVLVMEGITFIALQSFWNQDRLIVIYIPLVTILFIYAFYALAITRGIKAFNIICLLFGGLLLFLQLTQTFGAVSKISKYNKKFLAGKTIAGYPASISNFLQMCEWSENSVPDTATIGCNKPAEAIAFSHKLNFARLPKPIPNDADSVLALLKKNHISYLMADAAGMGQVNNVAKIIYTKYPQALEQVYYIGEMEPCGLLKIHYAK